MTENVQRSTDPDNAWTLLHRESGIAFLCHRDGTVYLQFNWNGQLVWELAGFAGQKRFPNWLRKVADKMEEKL